MVTLASDRIAVDTAHVEQLRTEGYTIIEDFLSPERLAEFRRAISPHLGRFLGRNSFEGRATERVYTLVARGRIFEDITADRRLMTLLGRFLRPGFLLSASHAINMTPGEAAQSLHWDDSFYPIPRPRPPISMSVIGAIDPVTAENGATVIYPRSHLWSDAEVARFKTDHDAGRRTPLTEGVRSLVMTAGAAAVFQGTLIHGAGPTTPTPAGWPSPTSIASPGPARRRTSIWRVRQDHVRDMSSALQVLLGYDLMPPSFMGQVTGSHPAKSLEAGWTAPVDRQTP